MDVESDLKRVGTVFVPSSCALFTLCAWLEYAWYKHWIAIVVLVVASMLLCVGVGCFVKGFLLTRKRERDEINSRGKVF